MFSNIVGITLGHCLDYRPTSLHNVDVDVDSWLCCSRFQVVISLDFKSWWWPLPPAHPYSGWRFRFHIPNLILNTHTHAMLKYRLYPLLLPHFQMQKVEVLCGGTGIERKKSLTSSCALSYHAGKRTKLDTTLSLPPSHLLNLINPIELPHLTSLFTQIIAA